MVGVAVKVTLVPLQIALAGTAAMLTLGVTLVQATNPAKLPVAAAEVTLMLPLTAPVGTIAVILLALTTLNVVASTPPKLTAVAPVNPEPVMVTVVPEAALVGVKEAIVGVKDTSRILLLLISPI